ncbi:phage tail tape measure protein [Ectobacillus ponti]|uniref:Phage tail tape measure protein n=1 Tax=Ectobacillus ponti TaxID=2961894 RepID=A0AA41XCV7_9BACI|nr:phage tail tape measure protein [Ectobacillus ponti]MCP8970575.1 phage tail tape measure protein [Ectobacillus ponti]
MSEVASIFVRIGANLSDLDAGMAQATGSLNRFGGQLRRLGNEINTSINASMSNMSKEFELWKARTGATENSTTGLTQKLTMQREKFQDLGAAIQQQEAILERLKAVHGENSIQVMRHRGSLLDLQLEYERLRGSIQQTENVLNRNPFQRLGASIKANSQAMQDVGKQVGMTAGVVGGVMATAIGTAVNKFTDFESGLSKVGALAGASKDDLKALSATALELGAKTSQTSTQVVQGMQTLAHYGFNAQQIMSAMPGILSSVEASGEDFAVVADTVASALNTWKMKAEETGRVSDVLAAVANQTAAGMVDMQYAFKYAAAPAASLGITMEQLSAAIGIMANNGIRGETAGTSLRASLLRLADPPKEAAAQLRELGVHVVDSGGKFVGLKSIVEQLGHGMNGMTDAQKVAAMSTIFGTEAVSGMLAIVNAGPQELDNLTKSLQNSGGASAEAAKKMKDNLGGSLDNLKGSVETVQIKFGEALAPAIRSVTEAINGLVNKFNALSPGTQQFIAVAVVVTTALILLTAVVGFLVSGLGALVVVEWAVIAPIIGIIAAVVAAIAIIVIIAAVIIQHWGQIKQFTIDTWTTVSSWLSGVWASIVGIAMSVWGAVTGFFTAVWTGIQNVFTTVLGVIQGIISAVFTAVGSDIQNIFNGYMAFFTNVWTLIKNIFLGALLLIVDLFTFNFSAMQKDAEAIWNNILGALQGIWSSIKQIFFSELDIVKQALSSAWSAISGGTAAAWNGIKDFFSSMWSGIKSIFSSAWDWLKSIVSNSSSSVIRTAEDMGNNLINTFKNIDLVEIGRNIIQGLINGIGSMASSVWKKVTDIADSVTNGLRKALDIHSPSRVTEDLGEFTGQGFAIGIQNTVDHVVRSSNDLAKAVQINPELSDSQVPAVRPPAADLKTNAKTKGDTTINVYTQSVSMDEAELVRALRRVEMLYG